jgi:hypothetical protein
MEDDPVVAVRRLARLRLGLWLLELGWLESLLKDTSSR